MRRPWRVVSGLGLALVVAVATPMAAQGLWGSSSSMSLGVQGAPFGVTATASAAHVAMDAAGTTAATGYVGVELRRLTSEGAVGWNEATSTATVGVADSLPGSSATIGYARASTAAACGASTAWSSTTATPPAFTSLPSPAAGQAGFACIRVSTAGLTEADNGRTLAVSLTPTVRLGGWSATAPAVTTTLTISGVSSAPQPVGQAVCAPADMFANISYPGAPAGTYTLRVDPTMGTLDSMTRSQDAAGLAAGWTVVGSWIHPSGGRSTVTLQIVNAAGTVIAATDVTPVGVIGLRCGS